VRLFARPIVNIKAKAKARVNLLMRFFDVTCILRLGGLAKAVSCIRSYVGFLSQYDFKPVGAPAWQ
jgi:hypothetical protein